MVDGVLVAEAEISAMILSETPENQGG
jgi:hypothetical protein